MADQNPNPIDTIFDDIASEDSRKAKNAAAASIGLSPSDLAKLNAASWSPQDALRPYQERKTGNVGVATNPNASAPNDILNKAVGTMLEGTLRGGQGIREMAGQKTRPASAAPPDTSGSQRFAKGASDLARGTFQAASIPAIAITNPLSTLVGIATATGLNKATEPITRNLPYGYRDLGQDAISAAGGRLAQHMVENPPNLASIVNALRHPLVGLAGLFGAKGPSASPSAATASPAPATATPAPTGQSIPLSQTTQAYRPAGTGAPPGPFNPNAIAPVGTNTGQSIPQMLQALQSAKNAAPALQPRSFELAPPTLAQQAEALTRLFRGNEATGPKVIPNQKPISSEEQVAEMLQSLKNAAPDLNARASSSSVPPAATPPLMRPAAPAASQGQAFPDNWRTLAEILRSIRP
jgi:hypothetical protein